MEWRAQAQFVQKVRQACGEERGGKAVPDDVGEGYADAFCDGHSVLQIDADTELRVRERAQLKAGNVQRRRMGEGALHLARDLQVSLDLGELRF